MKKKGISVVFIILISIVTITAVRYLSTDHTVSDCYYTQIPCSNVNRESWLIDDYGHKQPIGKEYVLVSFNALGERKRDMYYEVISYIIDILYIAFMIFFLCASIYLFILIVKALKKYINSKDIREEKKINAESLGEALK